VIAVCVICRSLYHRAYQTWIIVDGPTVCSCRDEERIAWLQRHIQEL
jgi:hypothetical protein